MKAIRGITSGFWVGKRFFLLMVFLSILPLFCVAGSAGASEHKLLASDGSADDYFGNSVEISGDYAIVGAPYSDHLTYGAYSGSAYIFHFDGSNWVEQQKLLPSDGVANMFFGCAVAISGDYAVVGAYGDANYKGAAYIFHYNGASWVQLQKLAAANGAVNDLFGYSVGISGANVIVGAYGENPRGTYSGAAYIFNFNGASWAQKTELIASDGAAYDFMGIDVAIFGNDAVVGAYLDDDKGEDSGSAYVFHYNGASWVQQQKLTASDGDIGDYFGWAVRISGGEIIVGASNDLNGGNCLGSAYIYNYSGSSWVQQQKLLPPVGAAGEGFGNAVAISGNSAVVGLYGGGNPSGFAYVYNFNGLEWAEQQELTATDAAIYFGYAVGISGDNIMVGAPGGDDYGVWSGSAYIVGPPTLTVSKSGTGTGTVASTSPDTALGCGATCFAAYAFNTSVTLIATADADSIFTGWTGCDTIDGDVCTVAMNDDRGVTATFADTTPPAAPVVAGVTPTNDTTPTWTWIQGGGGAGVFVYKLDSTPWSAVTTATVFTPSLPLTEGSHILYVKEQGAAGNWSAQATKAISIDLTPPETTLTGTPVNPTNITSATFKFTSSVSTFQCSLDGSAYADCASGVKYTGLTEGSHAFAVRGFDKAGNQDQTPAAFNWAIDISKPAVPVVSGVTPTNDTTPIWSWISGGGGNSTFRYNLDSTPWSSVTAEITFTPSALLAAGSHTLYVQERDEAGNWSSSGSKTIVIDLTPPETTLTGTPVNPTNITSATFKFTSSVSTFQCSLDGSAYVDCASGVKYTGLTEGNHAFAVRGVDKAGNQDQTPAVFNWAIDISKPAVPVVSGVTPTNDTTPIWSWISGGGGNGTFRYNLDSTPWSSVTAGTTFTPSALLAAGSHTLYVQERDEAGNWSSSGGKTIVIDLTPPETTLTGTPVNPTNVAYATFRFTGSGSTFLCSLDGGAFAPCVSGIKFTGLAAGDHAFSVQAVDIAGNQDPTPATFAWIIDFTRPTPPAVSGTTPTNDTTPTWSWSPGGGGNATFRYNLDSSLMAAATVTTDTVFTPAAPLTLGTHTLYVQERDAAGNWSPSGNKSLVIN